ncbi:MAG: hypothetical protein LLF94_11390 [Chlamydiales bacterium]|nr:hypothetical protein [Chlamydiales bacterium]
MATPYADNLKWNVYQTNPDWHQKMAKPVPKPSDRPVEQAVREVFTQAFKEPVVQGVQFVRDLARLVIKVPIRLIRSQSWQAKENAVINAKLAGYSLVRFAFVPVKLIFTISALFTSTFDKRAHDVTTVLNGRASQLEALKEEGLKNATSKLEYLYYKSWVYTINPELCR